ncbi:hypothetical protein ACIQ9E_24720 [Streptomyces sp. NPDC094448]|uniref:hypothetical protein n=1 Tax=Streptomyces sp. NPDC094448 TaxID=3366063 RepID=UPI0038124A5E
MTESTLKMRFGRSALSVAAAVCISLTMAGTANAAEDDGRLDDTEFGLYYNSNNAGCVFDIWVGDADFRNNYFKSPSILLNCSGIGRLVDNDAASYWNRAHETFYVFTGYKGGGLEGSIPAGYSGNASTNYKNALSSAGNKTMRDIWKP